MMPSNNHRPTRPHVDRGPHPHHRLVNVDDFIRFVGLGSKMPERGSSGVTPDVMERVQKLHDTIRELMQHMSELRTTLDMGLAAVLRPTPQPAPQPALQSPQPPLHIADGGSFPKLSSKIPPIYIIFESRNEFSKKLDAIVTSGIEIRKATLVTDTVRVLAETMVDYKKITRFCNNKSWEYYTYGLPEKRKLKVVVKGLPADIKLDQLKREIQSMQIPVCRVHKMHTTVGIDRPLLVLVVVNHNDAGKKMLEVKNLLGHDVNLERPLLKPTQCHRCQKWGHSQRFCHWAIKCVKCAGDHFSNKCRRDRTQEPPKCANCEGEHPANYKGCSFCPLSKEFRDRNARCGRDLITGARQDQHNYDDRECKNLLA